MNWSTPKWMVYKGTSHEKFMIWGYHFCWVLFPHMAMCFFVFFLLHPAAASSASTASSSAAASSTSHHQQHHLTISTTSTHNTSTPSSHSPSTRHHQHTIMNTKHHLTHHQHNIMNLRLVLRCKRSTWSTSSSFCVAGAALGAPPARFAWQAQHLEHLHRGPRKSGDN